MSLIQFHLQWAFKVAQQDALLAQVWLQILALPVVRTTSFTRTNALRVVIKVTLRTLKLEFVSNVLQNVLHVMEVIQRLNALPAKVNSISMVTVASTDALLENTRMITLILARLLLQLSHLITSNVWISLTVWRVLAILLNFQSRNLKTWKEKCLVAQILRIA